MEPKIDLAHAVFVESEAGAILELKREIAALKAAEDSLKDDIRDLMNADPANPIWYHRTSESGYSASLYQDRVPQKIKRSDTGFHTPLVVRDMSYTLPDGETTRRLFSLDQLMRLCNVTSDGVADVVKSRYLNEADAQAIFVKERVSVKPSLMIRPKVIVA